MRMWQRWQLKLRDVLDKLNWCNRCNRRVTSQAVQRVRPIRDKKLIEGLFAISSLTCFLLSTLLRGTSTAENWRKLLKAIDKAAKVDEFSCHLSKNIRQLHDIFMLVLNPDIYIAMFQNELALDKHTADSSYLSPTPQTALVVHFLAKWRFEWRGWRIVWQATWNLTAEKRPGSRNNVSKQRDVRLK